MPTFVQVWPFNFNAGGEPPQSSQIRFDVNDPTMTKMWVDDTTNDNRDVSRLLLNILAGARLYVQDRDNSAFYLVLDTTGPAVDKGGYAELPIAFVEGSVPSGAIDFYAPVTLGAPDPVPLTGTGTPGDLAQWTAPTTLGDASATPTPPTPTPPPPYVSLQQAVDHLLLPIDVTQDPPDARLRDVQQKLAAAQAIIFDYLKYDPTATVNPLDFPPGAPPPPDPTIVACILLQLGHLWGMRGDDEAAATIHSRTNDPGQMSQLDPVITNLLRRKRTPALA